MHEILETYLLFMFALYQKLVASPSSLLSHQVYFTKGKPTSRRDPVALFLKVVSNAVFKEKAFLEASVPCDDLVMFSCRNDRSHGNRVFSKFIITVLRSVLFSTHEAGGLHARYRQRFTLEECTRWI